MLCLNEVNDTIKFTLLFFTVATSEKLTKHIKLTPLTTEKVKEIAPKDM